MSDNGYGYCCDCDRPLVNGSCRVCMREALAADRDRLQRELDAARVALERLVPAAQAIYDLLESCEVVLDKWYIPWTPKSVKAFADVVPLLTAARAYLTPPAKESEPTERERLGRVAYAAFVGRRKGSCPPGWIPPMWEELRQTDHDEWLTIARAVWEASR